MDNKKIGILHFSDSHISFDNADEIKNIVKNLIEDTSSLLNANCANLDLVCFTGDLVNKGKDEEFNLALENIFIPLITFFNIKENDIFLVPGNHDIDISVIDKVNEAGLKSILVNSDNLNDVVKNIDRHELSRINNFYEFNKFFNGNLIFQNKLYSCYKTNVKNCSVGLACINSAWRSNGKGGTERGTIMIGKKQLEHCFDLIKECDIKICLVHHPIDWIADFEVLEIERSLSKYDIVLNGHIHINGTKQKITYNNGNTLYNTSGRLNPSKDFYNGYSLIILNPLNYECEILLRQYYDGRNKFDKALNLCEDGQFNAKLKECNNIRVKEFELLCNIKRGFINYINGFLVPNVLNENSKSEFDDIFVAPLLNVFSEYDRESVKLGTKETIKNDGFVELEELLIENDNILFIGKKEAGKTTLLHKISKFFIDNYNEYNKIPLLIDCKDIPKGLDVIEKAIQIFVNKNAEEGYSISILDIKKIIDNSNCIFIIDNIDAIKDKERQKLSEFIKTYSGNRYIFSTVEKFEENYIGEYDANLGCEYKKIYLRYMTKNQIRSLTNRWTFSQEFDSASFIEKLMVCFKSTNLPRTPFVVSLILSICNQDVEFTPINEASILERFMEILLEKLSKDEVKSKTYDFVLKENFLSYLATTMDKNGKYYFTYNEFIELTNLYHINKGFSLQQSNFDKLFFIKNILVLNNDQVFFRYQCMLEYYIAKNAFDNRDFLSEISNRENYIKYGNEIKYYTGLKRSDSNILINIESYVKELLVQNEEILNELKDYNINIDINLGCNNNEIKNAISKEKLSQKESDEITDLKNVNEVQTTKNYHRENVDEKNEIFNGLLILGSIIKNSELVDKTIKAAATNTYIKGYYIVLAYMKKSLELRGNEILKEIKKECDNDKEIENKQKELFNFISSAIKIALPSALQNLASDNIGTNKLDTVFLEGINSIDDANGFDMFLLVFLYCDLKMENYNEILKSYIKKVSSKDLLKIIFFKLLFYYKFTYLGDKMDDALQNYIADVHIRINGSKNEQNYKSRLIDSIKLIKE